MAADRYRAIQYKQQNKSEMNPHLLDYINAGGGLICLLAGTFAENALAIAGWIGTILSIMVAITRLYDWVMRKFYNKKDSE
jgi:hypothetical protein